MKIMIISDTHGDLRNFYKVLEREKPIDMLIHCGDVQGDELELATAAEGKIQIVAGNMDFYSELPEEKVFEVGGCRVFLTHGHLYGVNFGHAGLRRAAETEGADVAMFGHTHRPVIDDEDEALMIINPGSISFPRQASRKPTYAIMTIDENGEADYEIKYV